LRLLDNEYETFVAASSEAEQTVIDEVCVTLTNILKLCHASYKANGGGIDYFKLWRKQRKLGKLSTT